MMTFWRLNNENKSALFSLGEPVGSLVDTAWTCTIYRGHVDPVVTLLGTDLKCLRKPCRAKTLFLHDTVVCYKVKGHQCHANFIIAPSWWNPLYHQHSWYTSFHKKNINCTYLLFSMRKVNEKTEESFPQGRLQWIFFLPSGCSNTESRLVPAFACNYKQNVCNPKSKGTSHRCLKHLFGSYLCCMGKCLQASAFKHQEICNCSPGHYRGGSDP